MLVLAAVICSYYLSPSFHLNEIWQPLMDERIRQDSYEDQIAWMIFSLVKHGWNSLHLLRLCRWLPPWFRLENPQQTWLGLGKIKGLDCPSGKSSLEPPTGERQGALMQSAPSWQFCGSVMTALGCEETTFMVIQSDFMVISWWLRDSTASETGIWLEEIVAASILETEMI